MPPIGLKNIVIGGLIIVGLLAVHYSLKNPKSAWYVLTNLFFFFFAFSVFKSGSRVFVTQTKKKTSTVLYYCFLYSFKIKQIIFVFFIINKKKRHPTTHPTACIS